MEPARARTGNDMFSCTSETKHVILAPTSSTYRRQDWRVLLLALLRPSYRPRDSGLKQVSSESIIEASFKSSLLCTRDPHSGTYGARPPPLVGEK